MCLPIDITGVAVDKAELVFAVMLLGSVGLVGSCSEERLIFCDERLVLSDADERLVLSDDDEWLVLSDADGWLVLSDEDNRGVFGDLALSGCNSPSEALDALEAEVLSGVLGVGVLGVGMPGVCVPGE